MTQECTGPRWGVTALEREMPDQVGHDGGGWSGMTWVSARQVGQVGLEVKRDLSLHKEHRLAGDEDAG